MTQKTSEKGEIVKNKREREKEIERDCEFIHYEMPNQID